jgi:hypothetical protein
MKTLICKSCGFATYKESAACPNCRRRDLQIRDSLRTTGPCYYSDYKPVALQGSHPMVGIMAITGLSTLFSLIMYSHMTHLIH